MSKIETGGPAFPAGVVRKKRPAHDPGGDFYIAEYTEPKNEGMTMRQYAAIKLRVPQSGTGWLDEMIRESLRDEFAAKAMQGLIGETPDMMHEIAESAYEQADALLAARDHSEDVRGMVDADGWIKWKGGSRPVDPTTKVEVKLSDQGGSFQDIAGELRWSHEGDGDIIAYRVVGGGG